MQIRKIWMNNQLVYDISDSASAINLEKSTKLAAAVTIYDGAETQLPSSLQESYHGAGNVPAYRGMGIVEFDDLQLAQFGNGAVNVSCEVVVSGTPDAAPALVNSYSGRTDSITYDNGTIISGRATTPDASDVFKHVLERYDLDGNRIEYQETEINHGNFSSSTGGPKTRLGVNDPYLCEAYWDIATIHQRFSNPTLPSIKGQTTNKPHPFNTTWGEEPWGDSAAEHSWIRLGEYYIVVGGDNGPSRTTPMHLSRWPVITDITDPNWGYPTTDPDIALLIDDTYGADNPELTIDYSNNRIYLFATTSGNWHISSWDLQLNLLAHWQETLLSSPPAIGAMPYFSGARMLRKHTTSGNDRVFQYSFDPDDGTAEFVQTGFVDGTGSGTYIKIKPLTATLALTPDDIISVDPLINQADVALSVIFADVLALTGLQAADYDVTALTDTVKGYQASELLSARRSLEPLMTAYFVNATEVDNKIVFTKRGGASVKTIPDDDLVRQSGSLVKVTRASELELPKRVTLSYINQAADYQINEQHADRIVVVGPVGISNIAIKAVIDDSEAAQISDALLYSTWIERDTVRAVVSSKYFELTPADVITLGDAGLRVRITAVDTSLIGVIKLTGVIDYAASYVSANSAGAATASSSMANLPGPTIINLLDIPILQDADDGIIKYMAASGPLAGWGGAILYRSQDSGATYNERATSVVNAPFGFSTNKLQDGATATWDYDNTVNIQLTAGALASAAELAVLNGENAAAYGAHGRWEIIQFQDATLEGDGTYTLSTLLRGRRGTEHNTGNHVAGDTFVLLTESTLTRLSDVAADIGAPYLYKGVTIGNTIQDSQPRQFTNEGVSIKPFSVINIEGSRDGSNNLTTTYLRRDRLGYRANYTLPNSEDGFELEYWNTADTVQYGGTKTSSSQTHSYTAAQQTTDGATPGQAFLVKIWQISTILGRGYKTEAEI
jgi:hypothetical protein